MANVLDELTADIIIDGYGVEAVQRKKKKFIDAIITDDQINETTIISFSGGATSANLSTILTNGNNATNQTITGLGNPVFDQDATTKSYVDGYVDDYVNAYSNLYLYPYIDANSGGNLAVTLAKGNDADGYGIENLNYIDLTPTGTAPTHLEGRLYYDINDHTLNICTEQTGVTLNVGEEQYIRVVNKTGSTILNGQVVYINGAQGNRPTVALAYHGLANASSIVIGVCTADIANNQEGRITTFGVVREINTSSYLDGDVLYLSTTPGALTKIPPDTNPLKVAIALNTTINGAILVDIKQEIGVSSNSFSGTVPIGSDGYSVGSISVTSASNYVAHVYNSHSQRWSMIQVDFSGDGYFSFDGDFGLYSDKTTLLSNGAELRITYSGGTANIYLWKNLSYSFDYQIQMKLGCVLPQWQPTIVGNITTGSAYQTIGTISGLTGDGVIRYSVQDSVHNKSSIGYLNYHVSGGLITICSVDGIDTLGTSYSELLSNGLSIQFTQSTGNISIEILQDGTPKVVSILWEDYV